MQVTLTISLSPCVVRWSHILVDTAKWLLVYGLGMVVHITSLMDQVYCSAYKLAVISYF